MAWVSSILLFAAAVAPDALEIVKRAMNAEFLKQDLVQQYTMKSAHTERSYDKSGKLEKTESETHDALFVYGDLYRRLIERNGKPLSPADERKEEKKLGEFTGKRAKETPEQRQKRAADKERERVKRQALLRDVPSAFDFRIVSEEVIDGVGVWQIEGLRKPGFKPRSKESEVLSKLQGKLWVEKNAFHVVRADLELMEPVSFGWFIAKLDRGAKFRWDFTRVNQEVWLPKRLNVEFDVRLFGKKMRRRDETEMSGYRKFQVDSRVVSVAEH